MRRAKSPLRNPAQLIRSVLVRTKVIDASVGMFVALTAMAMALYRGGTWWEPGRRGHSFWENFLCDLLHRNSLSGAPNLVGSRLSLAAVLILVVGLLAAFSLSPEVIPSRKAFGRQIARLGSVGSLLVAVVPLLPSDRYPLLHSLAVAIGGLPGLVALTLLVGAMLLEPEVSRGLRALSVSLLVLVVVAMALYVWTAFFRGPSLRVLPGIERVANIALLLWLLLLARLVRLRLVTAYIALSKRRAAQGAP